MSTHKMSPLKRLSFEIALLAAVLMAVSIIARLSMKNVYTAYIPVSSPAGEEGTDPDYRVEEREADILDFNGTQVKDGYMKVEIRPEKPGRTSAAFADEQGRKVRGERFQVSPLLTVYDYNTGGFTGDTIVLASFAVFSLLCAVLLMRFFFSCRGERLYSYGVMYTGGFSVFAFSTGILMLSLTIRKILSPAEFTMNAVYSAICSASFTFISVTFPLVAVFALLLAVSNIALLTHERRRFANVLGILLAILLMAGEGIASWLYTRDFSGSVTQLRIHETVQNVYATAFAFFECMLLGAIVCALRAVRETPEMDKEYILILGCGFRKDGTLPPLLRGRVDRAVSFWRNQREKTGKTAYLVPSGGQGPNEVMAEAEAMARYLVSECGIPEEYIIKEDQSKNTYQNMLFSKQLIEERTKQPRAAFATTNYHVFRSGVWARTAGLNAQGMGSRTKWWFWPNAFIRECIGLMRARIRQEVILLVLLTGYFAALSFVLIG